MRYEYVAGLIQAAQPFGQQLRAQMAGYFGQFHFLIGERAFDLQLALLI